MYQALLVGSPNSGKSLLFNRLTGLNHKVGNFPGITVDVSKGAMQDIDETELVDFPGAYSMQPISGEEEVAVRQFHEALESESTSVILSILDVTRMEKGLVFTLEVVKACQEKGKPVVVLANMMDVLEKHGIELDCNELSAEIGVPVLPISGKSGRGINELKKQIQAILNHPQADNSLLMFVGKSSAEVCDLAQKLSRKHGAQGDVLVRTHEKLDRFFLNSLYGGIIFFFIMYLLFQAIFTWAAPMMDGIEDGIGALSDYVVPMFESNLMQSFLSDAVFGGIGSFLVFVPQVFILTFVVGILEDSGYLARAALICHRPLRIFGLTGKSFIPMLSGVACAIPAIYAARSIDSPAKRFLTYLAIPLMPCSARLPVYSLLIAALIPAETIFGGILGLQGLAMFLLYFFGLIAGLFVTSLVSSLHPQKENDLPFVLEMPPYRVPAWQPLVRTSWNRSKHFVTKAGKVIFAVTAVVWFLSYFPNGGEDLGESWLGDMGKIIGPVFEPIGLDWRYGVAIITSFLAREVFVASLGTMFGVADADETSISLIESIQASGLTLASGVALLVFFAIALQCVSTMAILRKESQSEKLPIFMFIAYFIFAYSAAYLAYHILL